MKQTNRMRQAVDRLPLTANCVLCVMGTGFMAVLTLLSAFMTEYMLPGEEEKMRTGRDSILMNLLVFLVFTAFGIVLRKVGKKCDATVKRKISVLMLTAAMIFVGCVTFWWILSADRVPEGDQAYIYGGASYFREGNYAFLEEGGYCSMFPYQLGLIALMEVLFAFVGNYNYLAFEIICGLMAVGIVLLGYLIVKEITDSLSATALYCVLIAGCSPLFFYGSWVYGDLPGTFFILLSTWALLRVAGSRRAGPIVTACFSMVLAALVRMHSMIFFVAAMIVGILELLQHKNKRVLFTVILSVFLAVSSYKGIYGMYEFRSGVEHSEGIPFWATVAMGLQPGNLGNGWCNDYHKNIWRACNFDVELTTETAKAEIRDRVLDFAADPGYAIGFFGRKIVSQWIDPLYQSLFFNGSYRNGTSPQQDSLLYKISHEYHGRVLTAADRLQFLAYAGMLLYFIFAVKRNSRILHHILAVTVLGGFLFSIIWEAKARYIFPYYVMMFPPAAVGYRELLCTLEKTGRQMREKIGKSRAAETAGAVEKCVGRL